ncbi:uncharacterized protein Z518_08251 [Rhinocladiella mackenziei CBS 650.93]|uniref:Uncharacterized protein n=1 Tax=Rhinocladiella mackenziei CBS 650.93 TaxID=1442369 RepID=A0A0D2J084_9EURO|nr:uncharacterized protein Z518_08251 [Rhinocladiella mackenziei CBS 650.93]KIX02310.1 hypothetical protein Z518_08251 [Rhinocladiella mackenziei CBS 650.93]
MLLSTNPDRWLGPWTTIGKHHPAMLKAMRSDVTRISNTSINVLIGECSAALLLEIGDSTEWTSREVLKMCNWVTAKMVGTMIAGREFGYDEMWLQLAPSSALTALKLAMALKKWPVMLRTIVANFIGPAKELKTIKQKMGDSGETFCPRKE